MTPELDDLQSRIVQTEALLHIADDHTGDLLYRKELRMQLEYLTEAKRRLENANFIQGA